MKQLTLNREYVLRHVFALVVFAGLGLWFGYDGFVAYPNTPAAQLYESIEKSAPPASMTAERLEAFKKQKIQSQYGFCVLPLIASVVVGLRLLAVSRLKFSFDAEGFTWNGRRHSFGDIKRVDRTRWEAKGILRLTLAEGVVTLDSWHHTGVGEFEAMLSGGATAVK